MNSFNNINEITEQFKTGKFEFSNRITLDHIDYINYSVDISGSDSVLVYESAEGNKLLFTWATNVSKYQNPFQVIHFPNIINETQISYSEDIMLYGFNQNLPIKAKIDTGADVCSLHATDINISGNQVSFIYNQKKYTMSLEGNMDVHQADSGGTSRPVVKFTVVIGDTTIPNIQFNLNDRSQMDSEILIGLNLLDKHQFTITTGNNMSENVDYNKYMDKYREEKLSQKYDNIIEYIHSLDVSLDQLQEYYNTL